MLVKKYVYVKKRITTWSKKYAWNVQLIQRGMGLNVYAMQDILSMQEYAHLFVEKTKFYKMENVYAQPNLFYSTKSANNAHWIQLQTNKKHSATVMKASGTMTSQNVAQKSHVHKIHLLNLRIIQQSVYATKGLCLKIIYALKL